MDVKKTHSKIFTYFTSHETLTSFQTLKTRKKKEGELTLSQIVPEGIVGK